MSDKGNATLNAEAESSPGDTAGEALVQQIAEAIAVHSVGAFSGSHTACQCDRLWRTNADWREHLTRTAVLPLVEAQVAPLRDEVEDYHEQVRRLFAQRDEARAERDAAEAEVERLSSNLGDLLCDLTGGLLSKTNYDVRTMVQAVEQNFQDDVDDAEARADAAESALRQVRELGDSWQRNEERSADYQDGLADAAEQVRAVLDSAWAGAADTQPEGASDGWAERVANIWRDSPKTRAALTQRYSGLAWALDRLAYPEGTPTAGGKVDTAPEACHVEHTINRDGMRYGALRSEWCGFTLVDKDGDEFPCGRLATGFRWYQNVPHEDALDVACELHENEGGRRIAEAEAALERERRSHAITAAALELAIRPAPSGEAAEPTTTDRGAHG